MGGNVEGEEILGVDNSLSLCYIDRVVMGGEVGQHDSIQ